LRRAVQALAPGLLAAALAACAPTLHTLEPYRSDAGAARALERRAQEGCAAAGDAPRALPREAFVTDGCSLWLDDGWVDPCCVVHDEAYWCGGEAAERKAADAAFRQCVDERASAATAWMMWLGVRAGGHPLFPGYYRWGYGRDYLPWYGEYPVCEENGGDDSQCEE
jgi:hypothetical protein